MSYGAEGSVWPRNALYLVNNTLLSDAAGAWFLRVVTEQFPAGVDVVATNNLTVGVGLFTLASPGQFEGNYPVLAGALGDPDTLDFRLGAHSLLRGLGVAPPVIGGHVARADGGVHVAGRHDAARPSRCVDAGRVPIARTRSGECARARRRVVRHTRNCS